MIRKCLTVVMVLLLCTITGCEVQEDKAAYSEQEPLAGPTEATRQPEEPDNAEQASRTSDSSGQIAGDDPDMQQEDGPSWFEGNQLTKAWAKAYCERDGQTLDELTGPDARYDLLKINYEVWPERYICYYDTADQKGYIQYYGYSSEPHIYTWRQIVSLEEKEGGYYLIPEQWKEYSVIAAKEELLEAFGNYGGELSYIDTGLGYQLNQTALTDEDSYQALFTPETAAPYYLHLAGGRCEVKVQKETYTIVTYYFNNNETVDFLMSQPYGKEGIWLVKRVDIDGRETSLQKSEEWYQKRTLEELDKLKAVSGISDIIQDNNPEGVYLLAEIPEDKVYMYVSAGVDVILRVKDHIQYFPWVYTSPRSGMPIMEYQDYDKDGIKEIAISLYTGTGTGVSVDDFYLVKSRQDGTLEAVKFSPAQYLPQLGERITAQYASDSGLQFFIDGEMAGEPVDISALTEWAEYGTIGMGEQIAFRADGDEMLLYVVPGCVMKDVAMPQYDNMPTFTCKFDYSDGVFTITDIKINKTKPIY